MSEIRELLASAQSAETRGDKAEAARLLREAAAVYRDRDMLRRAAQMLRQARRVEGIEASDEAVFGFGEDSSTVPEMASREPALLPEGTDAWCSFCCRPRIEVGALVSGPTGSYICQACTDLAARLLGGNTVHVEVPPSFELASQLRARKKFEARPPRLGLALGPQGTGKSTWAYALSESARCRVVKVKSDADRLDHDIRSEKSSVLLVVTADIPAPSFVLKRDGEDEAIYDTATLVKTVPQVPPALLAQVDAVFLFEPLDEGSLMGLGRSLAAQKRITLDEASVRSLVALAIQSGRGAHELAALLGRLPPGVYSP